MYVIITFVSKEIESGENFWEKIKKQKTFEIFNYFDYHLKSGSDWELKSKVTLRDELRFFYFDWIIRIPDTTKRVWSFLRKNENQLMYDCFIFNLI